MVTFVPPVAPLFVPASRPDRFHKADASGADAVILDLEDAVAPADKDSARELLLTHAAELKSFIVVRINGAGTPWHEADLDAVARLEHTAVMLPKAELSDDIASAASRLGRNVPFIPLVETAAGLARLPEILSARNFVMAAFGSIDFAVDLGCSHDRLALLAARSELVWRSRAANRAAPLDGVTTDLQSSATTEDDARHASELGFGGKLAIHPNQIEPILDAFRPDARSIVWANEVLAATSSGKAVKVHGEMVDRPVIERARQILARTGSGPNKAE
jgi:citrate lyase subunit beta/citryl-CoA lyase